MPDPDKRRSVLISVPNIWDGCGMPLRVYGGSLDARSFFDLPHRAHLDLVADRTRRVPPISPFEPNNGDAPKPRGGAKLSGRSLVAAR